MNSGQLHSSSHTFFFTLNPPPPKKKIPVICPSMARWWPDRFDTQPELLLSTIW